jgi:Tfp pilus assembly protein PilF
MAIESGFCAMGRARHSRGALGVVTLFVLAAFLSGCFRDPNVRKHKYLESGQKYADQGKDKEAVIQFANALRIDKNFAEAHYALAQTYLHMGVISSSYVELMRTVNLQPGNVKARTDLGNMLIAGGRMDDAQAQASAALSAQPNNADVHALLSRIALRRGQKDLALTEIHRALELAPNEAALYETLALLQAEDATQSTAVEAELKKAIELDQKSANAKLLLAAFYVRSHRLQDAEHTCWNAVSTDPKSLTARESLVQVILKEGDPARAEQVLRQTSNDLPDDPKGVRILADYYTETNQMDKAKAEFASLAKKYPKNLPVQLGYVHILLQTKDLATAQAVITELMKKHHKDPQVAVLNGIVLLNNGKTNDAVMALQDAVNNAPKDPFIQYWLGKAAQAKGDTSLAQKSFQQAAELNPRGVDAQEELARLALQRGDISLLSDVAEKTIAAAPNFPGGYLWRAAVDLSRKSEDKAEADLKTAMDVAPQSAQAYLMLGELRFAQKKYPESASLYEQALQYDPNSLGAMRGLINGFLLKKQSAQAMDRLNAQIAKSPKNSGFYDMLALFQIQNKNPDQAAVSAQKAIELNPDDGEAVAIYAQLQSTRGQGANAIGAWEKWSKDHPGNAGALAILGTLQDSAGDKKKAEEYYKKALQIKPDQPVAANNLAYMMLQNGENVDVALTLAQTARRGMPDSSNSADTLAWAYYYKGTYGYARDLLEDALKKNPNSALMHYHLGMVYSKLMDKTNAAIHLNKAIALEPNSQAAKDARAALQGKG